MAYGYTSEEIFDMAEEGEYEWWTVRYAEQVCREHGTTLAEVSDDYYRYGGPSDTESIRADVMLSTLGY